VAQIYCIISKGAKNLPNESKTKFWCVCTTGACVKYAPGGSTLEMGKLAKSGYTAFVAALLQVYQM